MRDKAFANKKKCTFNYSTVGYNLVRIKGSHQPKNESFEHHFCKMVSHIILYRKFNCRYIGSEVYVEKHVDKIVDTHGRHYATKSIIDTCGIALSDKKYDFKNGGGLIEFTSSIYGLEAKASLADYRNGFSAKCPLTYIICPRGVVPVDQLPDKIGLIYIDIPNFAYVGSNEAMFGVDIIKRAKKRFDKSIITDRAYDLFHDNIYDRIARANTIRTSFNPRVIPMYRYAPDNFSEYKL